ncbi:MAG: lysine N(6)-hydroxylase/L-ornithine N(5)-oxygenase family protein [Acidimicrobiia bacterium]
MTGVHDLVGVGLGPMGLSVAALADGVEGLDAVFLDASAGFAWHEGLLLEGTTLQVPFLADLVTLVDPTSPHSFLAYLAERDRLLRFYLYESFHVPRREYDAYCRWVAGRLPACRFGHAVRTVRPEGDAWVLEVDAGGSATTLRARAVAFAVGTAPWVPGCAEPHLGPRVLHSAGWAQARERVAGVRSVTVVGSGQSAAEVVLDLLADPAGPRVEWFTRSRGFLPMEYSKLGLEHFSPEYHRWFRSLPADRRDEVRAGQDLLYKGISAKTSAAIFDLLYERTVDGSAPGLDYLSAVELVGLEPVGDRWRLALSHRDEGEAFEHDTDAVVLATGYRARPLPVAPGLLALDPAGRPVVEPDLRLRLAEGGPSSLFVIGTELHSHGVGAPDLGLGALRAASIVNAAAGRARYRVPERTVFQRFGRKAWLDREGEGA